MAREEKPAARQILDQDLTTLQYTLRRHGWTIDLSEADERGARIAAHRDSPQILLSTAKNLEDLEE